MSPSSFKSVSADFEFSRGLLKVRVPANSRDADPTLRYSNIKYPPTSDAHFADGVELG